MTKSASTPAPGTTTTIDVLDRTFVIEDLRHSGQPLSRPIVGTLADTPRGRIARWAVAGAAGPSYGYRKYDADDPAKPPETLRLPADEVGKFLHELDEANQHPRDRCRPLEVSPQETEVQRFKREYPFICDALKLECIRPARVFDPGKVWVPVLPDPRAGFPEWEEFRDKHVSGDWGAVGRFDPEVPIDEVSLFFADLDDRRARASRAALTGAGMVVSLYPVEAKTPGHGLAILCRTALMPGREPVTRLQIVPDTYAV